MGVGLIIACAGGAVEAATPPSLYAAAAFDGGLGRINDLAFSSDGRLVAAAGARGVGVWDAQTGDPVRKDPSLSNAVCIAFGAQGTLLAVGGRDGRVTVLDLRSGNLREVARHGKSITAVALTADGRTGASGDLDGNVTLWEVNQGAAAPPQPGPAAPLQGGGHKGEILEVAFTGNGLLSASKDLQVVTWDTSAKRPIRRGTLQSGVQGRVAVPTAAAAGPLDDRLVVAFQLVSEQRGGVLSGGGLARPTDLRRENLLTPFSIASGISSAPVYTFEFNPERVALGPGACYAFFTSRIRDKARVHVWGLAGEGDDLTRFDLPDGTTATAIAVEPGGNLLAVALEAGRILTWRLSGATAADCTAYTKPPAAPAGPNITLGSETEPLIKLNVANRIAVLRFEATGVEPGLGDATAELVAGQLSNNPQITVIERSAIDAIVKELEIQRTGLTASDAVRIGRGLNARTVLLGGVRRFGESTYVITTRAVDVETQQVQGAREVTCENCKEQDIPKAVSALRRIIVP